MPITELEGRVGSRNVRRLSAAPTVGGPPGAPRARVSAAPVSGGVASPQPGRSSLHEVAEALAPFSGKLRKLADEAEAKRRDEQTAAGRLDAEAGKVRSLDDITDASEAYREGAAAAIGERIGFDALGELQRQADEGVNDPEFDFDAARQRVVTQFFGADPSRSGDPTLVSNGLDVFSTRSASVGANYREAVRKQLAGETRDVFLSNAATKARSLAELPAAERLPTLHAEMQALVADGRKLNLQMDDINNQRIFIVETLATETGDLGLFDTFAERDAASGTALRDHRRFGSEVTAAIGRASRAIGDRNAAANSVAKLDQILSDKARLSQAFSMTTDEVRGRVALHAQNPNDPRALTPAQGASHIETLTKRNSAELVARADVETLMAGGFAPTDKRQFAAIDRVGNAVDRSGNLPPGSGDAVRNRQYSQYGAVDPEHKRRMDTGLLSSNPGRLGPAIKSAQSLKETNRLLFEATVDSSARNKLTVFEALTTAGLPESDIVATLNDVTPEYKARRQEFLSNYDNRDYVETGLDKLNAAGVAVGNRSQMREEIRDVAGAIMGSGLVNSPEAAVDMAVRGIEANTVQLPDTEVRVSPVGLPFGMADEETVHQFKRTVVAPALRRAGFDPDRDVAIVPIPGTEDVRIVDEDSAVTITTIDFGTFARIKWRQRQNQIGGEATRAEDAAAQAVDRNQSRQDARTTALEGGLQDPDTALNTSPVRTFEPATSFGLDGPGRPPSDSRQRLPGDTPPSRDNSPL